MLAQIDELEETIIGILHSLSVDKAKQVLDFARFLQWQDSKQWDTLTLHEDETEEEVQADIERWDRAFATSHDKLKKLADEAREDIRAGRTADMVFTKDGRLAPG